MRDPIRSYYLAKEQEAHQEMSALQSSMRVLSWSRVALFILLLGSLILAISQSENLWFIPAVVFFVAFLVSIRRHVRKQEEYRFSLARLNVFRDELSALELSYDHYPSGQEHLKHEHPYAADLDLFGNGSIFQYLNRSTSRFGSDQLAALLSETKVSKEQILDRQEAVKELHEKRAWSEDFYASGRLTESDPQEKQAILEWLKTPYAAYSGVFYTTMLKSLPVLSIALLALSMMGRMPWTFFFLYSFIPLTVVGSKLKAMNKEYQMLSQFKATLSKYYRLILKIESESWKSELLSSEAKSLSNELMSAAAAFKDLRKISESLDNRNNVVGALVLNVLLLWDVRYALKLQKWKEENARIVPKWFDVIGSFEAMNSLSFLNYNRPDLEFPEILEEKNKIIEADHLGHVLLDPLSRVDNDFKMVSPSRFVILTGANMAGKSTFLRALGSNMILASAGAPVCAKNLSIRPLPLYSSMRTSDSLQSNESYFYAELKRLKSLLDYSEREEELFIILDEILKGTNSKDKAEGSALFVENILSRKIHGIIATHDLSLCELEEQNKSAVRNLSFDVEIKNNELHFDYKLRDGICQNMNATFLLNKMGLVNRE